MSERIRCAQCGEQRPKSETVSVGSVRGPLLTQLLEHKDGAWPEDGRLCRACMVRAREAHLKKQLEFERGELSELEREVAERASSHRAIAAQLDEAFQRDLTWGLRIADRVAQVGGSWPFVLGFLAVLVVWVAVNALLLRDHAFDPYPFILLNLVLSCIAALQAPVIMMSQNRSAARDRKEADEDYKINLKAELEIAGLHEKLDHVLHVQWDRMVEIQVTQLELLTELLQERSKRESPESSRQ